MLKKKLIPLALTCASMLPGAGSPVEAESYPSEQITMIIPFGAGGGSDRVARTIDDSWVKAGQQSFKFEYFPGAGGSVGASKIAEAKPDGYTLGLINVPEVLLNKLSGAATYDLDSFTYIGQVNTDPLVIMVPEDSPYQDFAAFAAAAKEAPGRLTFAVAGAFGAGQMVAQALETSGGIKMTLVPSQGGANIAARIAGGHVNAGTIGLGLFTTQQQGRALALTSAKPSALAPEIPTLASMGIDGNVAITRVVVAPKGIPDEAVAYLRAHLEEIVNSEGFQTASARLGLSAEWVDGQDVEQSLHDLADTLSKAPLQ